MLLAQSFVSNVSDKRTIRKNKGDFVFKNRMTPSIRVPSRDGVSLTCTVLTDKTLKFLF